MGPEDGKCCIILSPTRELAGQLFDVQKKVRRYHGFSAGLLIVGRKGVGEEKEHGEDIQVDVFKKLEKRKVLSNVEKSGLLSKADELGVILSSIERPAVFSKAEELGLLNLLERAAGISPAVLDSAALHE